MADKSRTAAILARDKDDMKLTQKEVDEIEMENAGIIGASIHAAYLRGCAAGAMKAADLLKGRRGSFCPDDQPIVTDIAAVILTYYGEPRDAER